MRRILDGAQQEIEKSLSMENEEFMSDEIPWTYTGEGLIMQTRLDGWNWEMLNNTLEGLRTCLVDQDKFEEVYVTGVVDLEANGLRGRRILSLLKISANTTYALPVSNDMERCYDPHTRARLLYRLGDGIGAYNMQQLLDGAEREIDVKLTVQGDVRVNPPWISRHNGLVLTADFEGWSWQVMKNTILAIRLCLFRCGIFKEFKIFDIIDPVAMSGQRYMGLKKEATAS
ncbi:MAG: hypothetical protein Q9174_001376 [Haloplaca sp. 1 TL-2023]